MSGTIQIEESNSLIRMLPCRSHDHGWTIGSNGDKKDSAKPVFEDLRANVRIYESTLDRPGHSNEEVHFTPGMEEEIYVWHWRAINSRGFASSGETAEWERGGGPVGPLLPGDINMDG